MDNQVIPLKYRSYPLQKGDDLMSDIRLLSALISAAVALIIAFSNHFIIQPLKAKRRLKRDMLTDLYMPLYGILTARINLAKDECFEKGQIVLGNRSDDPYLKEHFMEEFILNHAGYASQDLIFAWSNYSYSADRWTTKILVKCIVKEYNQLLKELGRNYNKEELETGIPEIIKEFRNMDENKAS